MPPAPTPLLLGHRGARSEQLENTYAAFDLALDHGCDGFEFDVRLTADGRALVCHDPKAGGVTIARAKSQELSQLPELPSVLDRYAGRAFLDIELKVAGLEDFMVAQISKLRAGSYVVSSFLPEVIRDLKARPDAIVTGWICDRKRECSRWTDLNAEYLIAEKSLLSESLVCEVHEAGRKVMVWTVNDAPSMRHFAEWGVDGIISDDTALLVRTLR